MHPAVQASMERSFGAIADLVRLHAQHTPDHAALADATRTLDYRALDALMDRVAASLQRDGLKAGDAIAICASSSVNYAAVFLGALRAGVAVAPLAPGSTPASLARMIEDADARILFSDASAADVIGPAKEGGIPRVALDGSQVGRDIEGWLAPAGSQPEAVEVQPAWAFNIIYSSGTTGEPKGIVQGHGMRWSHVQRGARYEYSTDTVTLLSTPLYSNTTLVVFFHAGFRRLRGADAQVRRARLSAAGREAPRDAHHARAGAVPAADGAPALRRARPVVATSSSSAPARLFNAALKADVLKRWPGGLIEFYGMTEGGGTCILEAHLHPTKLHTVGQPAEGQRHPPDRRGRQRSYRAATPRWPARWWATRAA